MASVEEDIANIKSYLNELQTPKHTSTMLQKIGTVETQMQRVSDSMQTCYTLTFFITFIFVLFLACTIYALWRMNVFKFLMRQNVFGRYKRPQRCYACYRPWRKPGFKKSEFSKASFSSPELMYQHSAPTLNIVSSSHSSSD
jgi:hypothetical protein